jgi:hypothetical protein
MKRPMTIREEANALTCNAFRSGYLERLHEGNHSELLEKPELSRITDNEIKTLMIESSAQLARLLEMKENDPVEYWRRITDLNDRYCDKWEKTPVEWQEARSFEDRARASPWAIDPPEVALSLTRQGPLPT